MPVRLFRLGLMVGAALLALLIPLSGSWAQVNPKAHNDYTQARFDLLDGNLGPALTKARRAHSLAPYEARYIYLIVDILREMKKPGEAEAFLARLLEADPQRYSYLIFDLAYLYVNNKKPEQAMELFRRGEKVDFMRAVKEQALIEIGRGKYERAVELLKRLPQDRADVKYLQAQSLLGMGDYPKARNAVQQALEMGPDVRQAKNLGDLMKAIKAAERAARPWQAAFSLMVQYDDNVFRDPLQDNPALVGARDEGDGSVTARLYTSYALKRTKAYSAGVSAAAGNTSYFKLSESNYAYWAVGGFWNYRAGNWGFRLPYEFSYYYAQGSYQRRLTSHTILPSLYWDMGPNFRTEFNGVLQRRLYFTQESDITRWGIGATHFYFPQQAGKHLRLGYRVNQDIADDDKSGYVSYQVFFGGAAKLWGPFTLDAYVTYTRYDHDKRDEASLLDSQGRRGASFDRRDDQYALTVQFIYDSGKRWQMILGYNHIYNDSNVDGQSNFDPYEFRQNKVWMMFNYLF